VVKVQVQVMKLNVFMTCAVRKKWLSTIVLAQRAISELTPPSRLLKN
jgi:hypothetical protein